MKSVSLYMIIAGLALFGGCQKNLAWTRLDGASADAGRLEKAHKACRIDTKLAGLDRAEQERDANLDKASTEQAKLRVENEYDQVKKQVYREIDTCMSKKGYRR